MQKQQQEEQKEDVEKKEIFTDAMARAIYIWADEAYTYPSVVNPGYNARIKSLTSMIPRQTGVVQTERRFI